VRPLPRAPARPHHRPSVAHPGRSTPRRTKPPVMAAVSPLPALSWPTSSSPRPAGSRLNGERLPPNGARAFRDATRLGPRPTRRSADSNLGQTRDGRTARGPAAERPSGRLGWRPPRRRSRPTADAGLGGAWQAPKREGRACRGAARAGPFRRPPGPRSCARASPTWPCVIADIRWTLRRGGINISDMGRLSPSPPDNTAQGENRPLGRPSPSEPPPAALVAGPGAFAGRPREVSLEPRGGASARGDRAACRTSRSRIRAASSGGDVLPAPRAHPQYLASGRPPITNCDARRRPCAAAPSRSGAPSSRHAPGRLVQSAGN